MSTAVNQATSIIGTTDFDEETWLVEPPNLPTQSNSTQESGRISEWLQGAAMNVDFQTRSALSRKLANQAARKKKRAEKLCEKSGTINKHRSGQLDLVEEELAEMNQSCNDNGDEKDLNEEQIISKWNNTCLAVENKNFDGQQLKVLYEQQPHAVSKINISSLQPIGSMAVIPNHDNDNADDNDDENDEFYDASSDFNDISPSPITPSIINTASIISSTTASQADSRDKGIWNGTSLLAAVSESVESSANSVAHDSSSNSLCHEIRQARQANTARVPPMITQNVTAQRSPLFDKSRLPYKSTKSHLLSAQPDLKDIKSIVERQEAELREELSKMKSSVQGEIVNKASPSRARNSQMRTARPSTAVLASSRSIEFGTKSPVAVQSPVYHTSRLPTPVRKSFGRSLIPTPRASTFSRSAIRSLAGGSTPSLVLSSQHVMDETRSECGGLSQNEQRWADECF